MAGFKITKDFLYEEDVKEYGESILDDMTGKTIDYAGNDDTKVRVYDDDNILYYEALCDGEEGAEFFHEWSEADSGSVLSKIYNKDTQKWEDFIG